MRGFTLIEVLLVMLIFGIVLGAVGDTVVAAYQNHEARTGDINMVRQGSIAIDTIDRELRMCEHLYYPDPIPSPSGSPPFFPSGANWSPLKSSSTPFVFTYFQQSSNSEICVGYWLNDTDNTIERFVYPAATQPGDFYPSGGAFPTPVGAPVTLASYVKIFQFSNIPLTSRNNYQFIGCTINLCRPLNPTPGQRFLAFPLQIQAPVISL
jgi:prepilin-type N-terminal cleavage/methylation domain-containing protein